MKCVTIKYKGHEVLCYGTLTDECDVDLVAIDSDGDMIENYVENWDYDNNAPYKTFGSLVRGLIDNNNFKSIEQIQAY